LPPFDGPVNQNDRNAFLKFAESNKCNHNPTSTPLNKELMRFASSELLKIETAFWPESQTETRLTCFCLNSRNGGGERDRTDDLLLAKQALSQLSYTPEKEWWVWLESNQRPPPYQDGALTS
jgi:hypothetical protein